jgi:hypothetical protein
LLASPGFILFRLDKIIQPFSTPPIIKTTQACNYNCADGNYYHNDLYTVYTDDTIQPVHCSDKTKYVVFFNIMILGIINILRHPFWGVRRQNVYLFFYYYNFRDHPYIMSSLLGGQRTKYVVFFTIMILGIIHILRHHFWGIRTQNMLYFLLL